MHGVLSFFFGKLLHRPEYIETLKKYYMKSKLSVIATWVFQRL